MTMQAYHIIFGMYFLFNLGCANAQSDKRPEIASAFSTNKLSVIEILNKGIEFYGKNECKKASELFIAAIDTGKLNNMGRTIAYWGIANCQRKLNNMTGAAMAYFGLIVSGQSVLDMEAQGKSFVRGFNLYNKLAKARAYLHFARSFKNTKYGRSFNRPIILQSKKELSLLISLFVNYCKGTCNIERKLLLKNGKPVIPHTESIILKRPHDAIEKFFLVVIPKGSS